MAQDAESMVVNRFKAAEKAEIPAFEQLATMAEQLAPFCQESEQIATNKICKHFIVIE